MKQLQTSGAGENYAKFQAENTEVLGIAATTMFAQKAAADFFKIPYPLLSGGRDVTVIHKVLKAYGVFNEKRLDAQRAYVIIDKDGIVRYKHITPSPQEKDLLPTETLLNEVKKVSKGS
jgi:peroxiredoxin